MSKRIAILLLVIFAFGSALRIYKLDASLHLDEIRTVIYFAEKPISYIMTHYPIANNHILHSILVHISMALFGESEVAIRLPAFLLGVLSIPLIYKVGKELFDERVGLVSAFLLSISTYHIWWSQQARGYIGLVFFSLLSLLFFLKAIKSDKNRYWLGFIFATALNVYTVVAGLVVLCVQALFVLCVSRGSLRKLSKKLIFSIGISLLIILLIYSLVLPEMVSEKARLATVWPPPPKLSPSFLRLVFLQFSLGIGNYDNIGLCTFLFFFVLGIIVSIKRQRKSALLAILWVTFPLVALVYFVPPWPRLFIFILPVYLIVISKGVASGAVLVGRSRLVRDPVVGAVFILAFFAYTNIKALPRYYLHYCPRENWREAAEYLKEHAEPHDGFVISRGGAGDAKMFTSPFSSRGDLFGLNYYLRNTKLDMKKPLEPLPEGCSTCYFIFRLDGYGMELREFCRPHLIKSPNLVFHKTFRGRCPIEIYVLSMPGDSLRGEQR